jgi:hypothetical protein
MPFFAPNHAIFEAIKYDGTPQCAKEIIKWAEQQIVTSDQIKFTDSRLLVIYYPGSVGWEKILEACKGDYITVQDGYPKILSKKDAEENYALIPYSADDGKQVQANDRRQKIKIG